MRYDSKVPLQGTKSKQRYELLTNDNTVCDNNRRKRDSEGSHVDTNGNNQTSTEGDLSKCESLHHWAAYQTQAARYCSIQVKN